VRLDGLRLQLLGLVILPFSLILLAVSIASVVIHEQAMRRLVTERDQRVAQAAAASVDLMLRERLASLAAFAFRLDQAGSLQAALEADEQVVREFDGGLAEFDVDGGLVAVTASWAGEAPPSLTEGLAEGETAASQPFREAERWMILAAARGSERVAVGALSLEGLLQESLASASSITDTATVTLRDPSGVTLAQVISAHARDDHGLEADDGSRGSEGEQVLATSPVADTGWTLEVEEPWVHITSPALDSSLVAPLVLIPALVVTLVGLGFGARRVIAPLRQLEQQASRLAEGDYAAAQTSVGGIAEVQHLQRTMAWMAERIRGAQEALQNYIGAITRAQEDERRRLARELHDETIQELIALDQRLQILAMDLRETEPSRAGQLDDLHRALNGAIHEVRRMTAALRPSYLEDLGLSPALEMLARDAEHELGIPVSFEKEGQPRRVSPEAELALFRIVQQALGNIGRHAEAKRAWVALSFRPDRLTTLVRDDGRGFSVPPRLTDLSAEGHFGLMGMKERAELAGGSLSIQSSPGSGTQVRVDVPLPPAE